jgi:hypothetical protein
MNQLGLFKALILLLKATPDNEVLFQRYGVTSSAIYIIRPDGYIGFRSYGCDLVSTNIYLKRLLQNNE